MPVPVRLLRALLPCTFVAALAANARAAEPSPDPADPDDEAQHRPIRLELMGGAAFGNVTLSSRESANGYGAAATARAGYTFSFGLNLALRYDHFFGTTTDYRSGIAAIEHHTGASFIAGELGYELRIAQAIIRPHVAAGASALRIDVTCSPTASSFGSLAQEQCGAVRQDETHWSPGLTPGLLMGLAFGRLYGFTEVRYYIRDGADAFGVFGGAGLML